MESSNDKLIAFFSDACFDYENLGAIDRLIVYFIDEYLEVLSQEELYAIINIYNDCRHNAATTVLMYSTLYDYLHKSLSISMNEAAFYSITELLAENYLLLSQS